MKINLTYFGLNVVDTLITSHSIDVNSCEPLSSTSSSRHGLLVVWGHHCSSELGFVARLYVF